MKYMTLVVIVLLINMLVTQQPAAQPLNNSTVIADDISPHVTGRSEKTLNLEPISNAIVLASASIEPVSRIKTPTSIPKPVSNVILYTATWCAYCKTASAYLSNKGGAYQGVDIDTQSGREVFAQTGGNGVPLLYKGRQHVEGFSQVSYDALFSNGK